MNEDNTMHILIAVKFFLLNFKEEFYHLLKFQIINPMPIM